MKSLTAKRAFTVVELMVVVCMVGILAGITVPGFVHWRNEYRVSCTAREIASTLQLAKVSAAKLNATVVVAFDETQNRNGGYVMFQKNTIPSSPPGESENILGRYVIPQGVELKGASFGKNIKRAIFSPMGFPQNRGSIILKNINRQSYRKVTLSRAGNIYLKKGGLELLE